MEIKNEFVESSLIDMKQISLQEQQDRWMDLQDITELCKQNKEKIIFDDNKIWDVNIGEDETFVNWLYGNYNAEEYDLVQLILELIGKDWKGEVDKNVTAKENSIAISFGKKDKAVSNREEYLTKRRDYLNKTKNPEQYCEFMESCFPNSSFAKNIKSGLEGIQNFSNHKEEITRNLTVLDKETLNLYEKYRENLKEAINILSTKLLSCSLDPKHRKELLFEFEYENEKNVVKQKYICCEPHLKLIRPDSDLRIYFYWKDEQIGDGKKVLIGRIGGHPYKK